MIKDNDLRDLHVLELKIMREIRRICEKNGISYFLLVGTMLGAVRHGGFIPWDEDVDLGMCRSDYQRFKEACRTDLGEEFFYQDWDTDPEFPYAFAKIRLKDTLINEEFCRDTKFHHGIFVDIFPFDNVPEGSFQRKLQGLRYFFYKRMLWMKKGCGTNLREKGWKQRLKYDLFRLISLFFPYEFLKERFRKIMQRYNGESTSCVVSPGTYNFQREMTYRHWVEDLAPIGFEDDFFPGCREYDAYLTHVFGDYHQFPPEEQRHKHDVLSVDLGPYESMLHPKDK